MQVVGDHGDGDDLQHLHHNRLHGRYNLSALLRSVEINGQRKVFG